MEPNDTEGGENDEEELARLRAENEQLRQERAELYAEYVILKAALFCREWGPIVLVLAALIVGGTLLAVHLLR